MIVSQVAELIGETPLYHLSRDRHDVYIKLEQMNIGGSIKDRLGYYLIERALATGLIRKGDTVIEPTAGNTGIGLALACLEHHLHLVVVVPEKFSVEKQQIMHALGAKIVLTPSELGMDGAISEAKDWLMDGRAHYMPNQFENTWNPAAYHTLADELWRDAKGQIDLFVAGGGSGGTFTGVLQRLRHYNSEIQGVLVQPKGSGLVGDKSDYAIEGIGMDDFAPFMVKEEINEIMEISDREAFYFTKQLAARYGLLVGSSSGAAFAAVEKILARATKKMHIVTIFPDGAERYLQSGIYERSGT